MHNGALIDLVRERPALWDPRHQNYKKKEYSKLYWEEIAQSLTANVEDIKLRWKTLRDRFMKEQRKASSGSGTRAKWNLLESLQFLKLSVSPGRTTSNHVPQTLSQLAGVGNEEIANEIMLSGTVELSDVDDVPVSSHRSQPSISTGSSTPYVTGRPTSRTEASLVPLKGISSDDDNKDVLDKVFLEKLAQKFEEVKVIIEGYQEQKILQKEDEIPHTITNRSISADIQQLNYDENRNQDRKSL